MSLGEASWSASTLPQREARRAQAQASGSRERWSKPPQTKAQQQEQPRQAIPEKHQSQIDYIDKIYNQVVLKKESRQEKKKQDKALGLEA